MPWPRYAGRAKGCELAHYDYVDIGTCDFNYTVAPGQRVLLVEPLRFYLDAIPKYDGLIKAAYAISDFCGTHDMQYVDPALLPSSQDDNRYWMRGCTMLEGMHPLIETCSLQAAVRTQKVDVITFARLQELYDITSIGHLKIDTEGHESKILDQCAAHIIEGLRVDTIDVELHPYLDIRGVASSLLALASLGYRSHARIDLTDNGSVLLGKISP